MSLGDAWTRHLRRGNPRNGDMSCPLCEERPPQRNDAELFAHINAIHWSVVPPERNEVALEAFRKDILEQAVKPRPLRGEKPPTDPPEPGGSSGNVYNSAPENTGHSYLQRSDHDRQKASQRDEDPQLAAAAESHSVEHARKKQAMGEGNSPSSSASVRSNDSPKRSNTQRTPGRPSAGPPGGAAALLPAFEAGDSSFSRPAAGNKRLFQHDAHAAPKAATPPSRVSHARNRPSDATGSSAPASPQSAPRTTPGIIPTSILTNVPPPQRPISSSQSSPMATQVQARPISQDQLITEVRGIYAGLTIVESKCIQVDLKQQQLARDSPNTRLKLGNEQWQALIALHRTLLHEHHDFFLASQHPSTTPGVRRLAQKYNMPARLWKHGIHSFLELLRSRLPEALEHMLSFIYLSFNILTLLYETVPLFENTWIECLGDLGRYRMAIEDHNARDIEIWTQVSRRWYLLAANRLVGTGRLYHHLAILARPDALPQILYYGKALAVEAPFPAAKESIMILLDPALSGKPTRRKDSPAIKAFIRTQAILFSKTQLGDFSEACQNFTRELGPHIARIKDAFRPQGYYMAISICIAMQEFKFDGNTITRQKNTGPDSLMVDADTVTSADTSSELKAFDGAQKLAKDTLRLVLTRAEDPNTRSFIHVLLAFTVYLSRFDAAMEHFAGDFPWEELVDMLNTALTMYQQENSRSELKYPANMVEIYDIILQPEFPIIWPKLPSEIREAADDDDDWHVPEDWVSRGLPFANYVTKEWFSPDIEAESHYIELEKVNFRRRPQRIFWHAGELVRAGWLVYDSEKHVFSVSARSSPRSALSRPEEQDTEDQGPEVIVDFADRPEMSSLQSAERKGPFSRGQQEPQYATIRTQTWATNETTSTDWSTNTDVTETTAMDCDEMTGSQHSDSFG